MFCPTNHRDMIEHVALHVLCEMEDRDTLFRAASVNAVNTRDRIARHSFRCSKAFWTFRAHNVRNSRDGINMYIPLSSTALYHNNVVHHIVDAAHRTSPVVSMI